MSREGFAFGVRVLTVRRGIERQRQLGHHTQAWHAFDPRGGPAPESASVAGFDEYRVAKGARIPGRGLGAERLTYVHEGAIAYPGPGGVARVLRAGEFQRLSFGCGEGEEPAAAASTADTHLYQIDLFPTSRAPAFSHEERRFSVAQRGRDLCLVASPDGRSGSLRLRQDTFVYSAVLLTGHHLAHQLRAGRAALLHVVDGEVSLGDGVLGAGDAALVTQERVLSLTARCGCELLVLDLPL